jgi:hypothetical protein
MSGSITNSSSGGGNVIGSGSDTITIRASGDSYGPAGGAGTDALFTLNVDGQQIGGLQDVSASHANGEDQTFTFQGDFNPGSHAVTITFANNTGTQGDKTTFGRDGGDRNLYIDGVSYNGQTVTNGTTPIYSSPLFPPNGPYDSGNAVFNVNDTTSIPSGASSTSSTTPGPIDVGSGADTVALLVSEDPYMGDAQFTVSVDGKQVGGTLTTTAVAWQGQQQAVYLHGDWGSSAHTVTVSYLSDTIGALGPTGTALDNQDQNLYVTGVSYDGIQAGGTPWELDTVSSHSFQIGGGGQPGDFVAATTANSPASSGNGGQISAAATGSGSASVTTPDSSGTSTTTTASQSSGNGTIADNSTSQPGGSTAADNSTSQAGGGMAGDNSTSQPGGGTIADNNSTSQSGGGTIADNSTSQPGGGTAGDNSTSQPGGGTIANGDTGSQPANTSTVAGTSDTSNSGTTAITPAALTGSGSATNSPNFIQQPDTASSATSATGTSATGQNQSGGIATTLQDLAGTLSGMPAATSTAAQQSGSWWNQHGGTSGGMGSLWSHHTSSHGAYAHHSG